MSAKIDLWKSPKGRKLRVVFVDDQFHEYVDLPAASGAQREYESDLRGQFSANVSLYKPGSSYRDFATPALTAHNLTVFRPGVDSPVASLPSALPTARSRTTPDESSTLPNLESTVDNADAVRDPSGFRYWWSALAAVPGSTDECDWWAKLDGRASRHARLQRVWFDSTRNHWFFRPDHEDHLTATLWENLHVFEPSTILTSIFQQSGLPAPSKVLDCCWSYEFEQRVNGRLKQADIVLHYRDAQGDGILVVEAKRPKGPLKDTDRGADYYLDLPAFGDIERRTVLYLVADSDLESVKRIVNRGTFSLGFLTWSALCTIQVQALSLLALPERLLIYLQRSIQWQFNVHGLQGSTNSTVETEVTVLDSLWRQLASALDQDTVTMHGQDQATIAGVIIEAVLESNWTPHVRSFVAGMVQHQACWYGIRPTTLAAPYLAESIDRDQIRKGMPNRQRTADRLRQLWRIPSGVQT